MVKPWELAEQPVYWSEVAAAAEGAELEAQEAIARRQQARHSWKGR